MKFIPILLIALLAFSCKTSKSMEKEAPTSTGLNLESHIFDMGAQSHLTDSCSFAFDCDCCEGGLILNPNQTFYATGYCLADFDLLDGKYTIEADTLTLAYNGIRIHNAYDWAQDAGSGPVEYIPEDSIISPFRSQYLISTCGDHMQLIRLDKKEYGMETQEDYGKAISSLKEKGIIARLDSLKAIRKQ